MLVKTPSLGLLSQFRRCDSNDDDAYWDVDVEDVFFCANLGFRDVMKNFIGIEGINSNG
jgi:hypothetical protein